MINLLSASFSVVTIMFTHVYELNFLQEDMKLEMAKPGKNGLEKTDEECVKAFSMAIKKKGIAKNTFLRNAGLLKCKSMSKSKYLHARVLEEQLQVERAASAALRLEVDNFRTIAAQKEALLEQVRNASK
jgi:hypothetical protein